MKTAGEILSALFDEGFVKKAQGYSKFFDSWTDITAKNGIASAAAHSRIKDMDKGIVLIEMDHPGWKQIIQTKQSKILNDFRIRFPELDISGISLMLGSGEPSGEQPAEEKAETPPVEKLWKSEQPTEVLPPTPGEAQMDAVVVEAPLPEQTAAKGYDAIKDKDFKEKLIRLGQTVAEREKRSK